MGFPRAVKIFRTLLNEAGQYESDPARTSDLADRAGARAAGNKSALSRVWLDFTNMLRMLKAWATRKYPKMPVKSVTYIIGAVLYFMSPIDAIPDFLPIIGFMDDAFIITLVMRAIRADISAFHQWEQEEQMLGMRAAH